jgi:hypothetical protein
MSPKRWLFYCPDCAKREFEVTMADLDGLDHERRGLVSIVVPNVHPAECSFPSGIVSPARQLGTATLSFGGSEVLAGPPQLGAEPSRGMHWPTSSRMADKR